METKKYEEEISSKIEQRGNNFNSAEKAMGPRRTEDRRKTTCWKRRQDKL